MTNNLSSAKRDLLKTGTVFPACPLALHKDRTFDEFHQRMLAQYYMASGVGGIAVGVHTTQFEIRDLKYNLFEPVLKTVSDEIKKENLQRPFIKIAGICGPTEQAISEVETALKYDYDIALLNMASLNQYSDDYLLERTREVANRIPVFGFYLQKTISGRTFSFDFWRKFVEIDNVIAVKTAPFNRYQTLDVVRAVIESSREGDISLYTGNDDNIIPDLLTEYKMDVNGSQVSRGFDGGLLGHWAVWSSKAPGLLKSVKESKLSNRNYDDLLRLGTQITDCNGAFFDVKNSFKGSIAGINEVLSRQGLLEGNYCLCDKDILSDDQIVEIDRVYSAYPELNDDDFVKSHLHEWEQKIRER